MELPDFSKLGKALKSIPKSVLYGGLYTIAIGALIGGAMHFGAPQADNALAQQAGGPPEVELSDPDESLEEICSAEEGWYGEYFNYTADHPDMDRPTSEWPDDNHGDPLSVDQSWDTDWYQDQYFEFDRIDSQLQGPGFGGNFFPFDGTVYQNEDIDEGSGEDYHFGARWSARVTADATQEYGFEMTSDDDAWVYIDGELKADNSGIHPPETKNKQFTLTEGVHEVQIFFAERHTVKSHFKFKFTKNNQDLHIAPLNSDCLEPVEGDLYLSDDLNNDTASDLYKVQLEDHFGTANLEHLITVDESYQTNSGELHIGLNNDGTKLYGIDKETGDFGYYDVGADSWNHIGTVTHDDSAVTGIVQVAVGPSGTLYAASMTDDTLYSVDKNNGTALKHGEFKDNFGNGNVLDLNGFDIAFDADGNLYLENKGSDSGLYQVYLPGTGDYVPVERLGNNNLNDGTGLAFTQDGAGDMVGSDTDNDTVTKIDKTNGNAGTQYEMLLDGESFDHQFGDMASLVPFAGSGDELLCGENLLTNGDFENPTVHHNSNWNIFDNGLPGLGWNVEWTETGDITEDGETVEERPDPAHLELQAGVNGWGAQSGDQYAELDSDWDGPDGDLNGEPGATKIYQDFPTKDGELYNLTFWYAPRPGTDSENNAVEVTLGSQVSDTLSPDGSDDSNPDWQKYSYDFIGDGNTKTLTFEYTGTSDALGGLLDNVSVEELCPNECTLEGESKKLWQIGDIEESNEDNPADEFNWPDPYEFGTFPDFTDPFYVADSDHPNQEAVSDPDSEFPWNSNANQDYATDFDVDYYFNGATPVTAELTVAWTPGHNGHETKRIILDDGSQLDETLEYDGAQESGWFRGEVKVDTFEFILTPGEHTFNFKHLTGTGTLWDYVRLDVTSCGIQLCESGPDWADSVEGSEQGLQANGEPVNEDRSDPAEGLGEADGSTDGGFYSLGENGTVTYGFDKYVWNIDGADLSFHEVTGNGSQNARDSYVNETATVEVSQDGTNWTQIGTVSSQDNDSGPGVSLLDFDSTGWQWIKYVRLTDTTDFSEYDGTPSDGYDLDAIDTKYEVCNYLDIEKNSEFNSEEGTITYFLDWELIGEGVIFNPTITDEVPEGLTVESISDGGTENSGTITWNLGNWMLAPSNGTVSFTASIDAYSNVDSWADSVESFTQGEQKNGDDVKSQRSDETKALGEAQRDDTINFVSLGFDDPETEEREGVIDLRFDEYIVNGPGDDLEIVETSFNEPTEEEYPETANIYVSKDGVNWQWIDTIILDGTSELVDLDNGSAPIDWARFVRIEDASDRDDFEEDDVDGFDVDGVKALHALPGVCDVENNADISGDTQNIERQGEEGNLRLTDETSNTQGVNAFACEDLYLSDTDGTNDGATDLYSVELNDLTGEAVLTHLINVNSSLVETDGETEGPTYETLHIGANAKNTEAGDRVYGIDDQTGNFGYYDVDADEWNHVGTVHEGEEPITGIVQVSFTPGNTLFALDKDNDTLYQVDKTDGSATEIGQIIDSRTEEVLDVNGYDLAFDFYGDGWLANNGGGNGLYKLTPGAIADAAGDPSTDVLAEFIGEDSALNRGSGSAITNNSQGLLVGSNRDSDKILVTSKADGSAGDEYDLMFNNEPFDHHWGDMASPDDPIPGWPNNTRDTDDEPPVDDGGDDDTSDNGGGGDDTGDNGDAQGDDSTGLGGGSNPSGDTGGGDNGDSGGDEAVEGDQQNGDDSTGGGSDETDDDSTDESDTGDETDETNDDESDDNTGVGGDQTSDNGDVRGDQQTGDKLAHGGDSYGKDGTPAVGGGDEAVGGDQTGDEDSDRVAQTDGDEQPEDGSEMPDRNNWITWLLWIGLILILILLGWSIWQSMNGRNGSQE